MSAKPGKKSFCGAGFDRRFSATLNLPTELTRRAYQRDVDATVPSRQTVRARETLPPWPFAIPPAPALAALLAGAGVTHLAMPSFYDAMIPAVPARHPPYLDLRQRGGRTGRRRRRSRARAPVRLRGRSQLRRCSSACCPATSRWPYDARRSDSAAYRARHAPAPARAGPVDHLGDAGAPPGLIGSSVHGGRDGFLLDQVRGALARSRPARRAGGGRAQQRARSGPGPAMSHHAARAGGHEAARQRPDESRARQHRADDRHARAPSPTCRLVEATAAAVPAWARGMPDTAVFVIGAFTSPNPAENTT